MKQRPKDEMHLQGLTSRFNAHFSFKSEIDGNKNAPVHRWIGAFAMYRAGLDEKFVAPD